MDKKAIIRKTLWHIYFIEGLLTTSWIIYLMYFYSFYKDAYFYIDKRQSFFLQILSILNDNWNKFFIFFSLSFFLISLTFFLIIYHYIIIKKDGRSIKNILLFSCLNLFSSIALLMNICWPIFLIILILAASLIYIIFILANKDSYKEDFQYEEGEIIEVKGPYETREEAQKDVILFLNGWQGKETLLLNEEIYLEDDNKYYAEIYIEKIIKQ